MKSLTFFTVFAEFVLMSKIRWAKLFLLILIIGFAPFHAFAKQFLTWNQCVDLVKQNNPELKSAIYNLKSLESQEKIARANFLPQINANANYNKTNRNFTGPSNDFITSVNVTGNWNLFSGFADISRWDQAKANTEAQKALLQSTKAQVSLDLKTAYQNFIFAKEFTKLTKEIIKRREENLRLVELRFESGLENKGSVLLSKANAEQAKYDNLQAENSEKVAMAQLAKVLGLDEFSQIDVQEEIPVKISTNVRPNFQNLALTNPEVLSAQAKELAAKENVDIAQANFYPALNLSASTGKQLDPSTNSDQIWSVGLSLSFNIFNGGSDYYGIKSASALRSTASLNLENTRRSVVAKLEQAYSTYIESISKLKVDATFREATLLRSDISRRRYNNGLLTFDNWIIIEDDLIARQKAYLQSVRNRVLSEATYEQALGTGVVP